MLRISEKAAWIGIFSAVTCVDKWGMKFAFIVERPRLLIFNYTLSSPLPACNIESSVTVVFSREAIRHASPVQVTNELNCINQQMQIDPDAIIAGKSSYFLRGFRMTNSDPMYSVLRM